MGSRKMPCRFSLLTTREGPCSSGWPPGPGPVTSSLPPWRSAVSRAVRTFHRLRSAAKAMRWARISGEVMTGVKSSGPIRIAGGMAGSSVLCHRWAYRMRVASSPSPKCWHRPSRRAARAPGHAHAPAQRPRPARHDRPPPLSSMPHRGVVLAAAAVSGSGPALPRSRRPRSHGDRAISRLLIIRAEKCPLNSAPDRPHAIRVAAKAMAWVVGGFQDRSADGPDLCSPDL